MSTATIDQLYLRTSKKVLWDKIKNAIIVKWNYSFKFGPQIGSIAKENHMQTDAWTEMTSLWHFFYLNTCRYEKSLKTVYLRTFEKMKSWKVLRRATKVTWNSLLIRPSIGFLTEITQPHNDGDNVDENIMRRMILWKKTSFAENRDPPSPSPSASSSPPHHYRCRRYNYHSCHSHHPSYNPNHPKSCDAPKCSFASLTHIMTYYLS